MTDVDPMDDFLQNHPLLMIRVVPDSHILTEEDRIASLSAMEQLSESPNFSDLRIQVVKDPDCPPIPDLFSEEML